MDIKASKGQGQGAVLANKRAICVEQEKTLKMRIEFEEHRFQVSFKLVQPLSIQLPVVTSPIPLPQK
jgi:hypothetical protein